MAENSSSGTGSSDSGSSTTGSSDNGSSTAGSSAGSSTDSGSGSFTLVSGTSSGYRLAGVVQVGSNGAGAQWPAYYLELDSGASSGQMMEWDGNVENGFDSDRQQFALFADLTGTVPTEMSVSSVTQDDSINLDVSGSGFIVKLQIAAQANAASMRFSWSVIIVNFENADGAREQVSLPAEATPVADTFDGQESNSVQVVEITPLREDYTKVSVEGFVQLESSLTTLPAADAMVAKVLVFVTGS